MCTDDRSSGPACTWELVLAGRVKIGASIYLEVLYFKLKKMVKCPSIFYNKNNKKGLDKKRGISFPLSQLRPESPQEDGEAEK